MSATLPTALRPGRSLPELLSLGGLALAAAVFLWQLPFFLRGGAGEFLTNLGHHAYVVAWLLVITVLGRTLPLRTLPAAFFVGLFASMAVVLGVGFPLGDLIGKNVRLFDSVVVPLLEESAKGLPVLLFFWWLTRRGAWQPAMTDGLLMGYLVGAGFAIHENAMYGRASGSGFGGSELSLFFPTISEFRLMPSGRGFSVGHAEWTALLGLSIGAAFFFRERLRWSWLVPVAAFALVSWDHGRVNYIVGTPVFGEPDWIYRAIRGLVLDGRLPVYLLLAGTVAAVVTELVVLRRMAGRDRLFRGIPLTVFLGWLQSGSAAGLRLVQAARAYGRARRSVHYTLWRVRPRSLDRARVAAMGLMLLRLGERAGLTFAEPKTDTRPASE